jgi:guanine deaminase
VEDILEVHQKLNMERVCIRGHFVDTPDMGGGLRSLADGLLILEQGRITWFGDYDEGRSRIPAGCPVETFPGRLIVPGLIDCHVHFPQMEIIGSYGEQLLEWLEKYAFPAEEQYGDQDYAGRMAGLFLDQLLANGTTTAMVFCTVHPQSAEALFAAAEKRGMRLVCGKVLMDRNCPQSLQDTAEQGYEESRELIGRWHGRARLGYAVTPRFAPTSTPAQLELAGTLLGEFPGLFMQTHLSENLAEIAWVRELFPGQDSYLEVYHQAGLTGPGAVFAHCLHLEDGEWELLAETGSAIGFCPTSNLFLGSGLFDLATAREKGINVGLATDVGGGTSLSMLQTLREAYQVCQLQGQACTPADLLHLATLGAARALGLADRIGSFASGKEADFVVLDPRATDLLALRADRAESVAELLFSLMILGDERAVSHTYVAGKPAYEQKNDA